MTNTTHETCEDRDYRCCDMDDTPSDDREGPTWYDQHVAAYHAKVTAVQNRYIELRRAGHGIVESRIRIGTELHVTNEMIDAFLMAYVENRVIR